jgi:tape measure domain-containing protein
MAQQIGSLYASMTLESANFINGLERATKATDRASTAIEKGLDRAGAAVKGFVAVYAADKAIDGAKRYLELADAAKKMEAQLKLATAQMGNMGAAQRDVHNIAKETRAGLQETVDLYAKFLPAARDLGKGQTDAARATETFSKALKIGGADTNAAASATLQFGQALASGVLRGDEFNSVNEASPRIMRLLAESMGQPVGALRKMAEEGKLTSDVLFKALTDPRFTASIDAEFKELPTTFEQAKTLMENSLTDLIGAFDRGAGISDAIAEGLGEGTTMMDDLVRAAEEAGADIRATFAGLDNAFNPLGEGAASVFDAIRKDSEYTRETIGNLLRFIDKAHNAYAAADNFGTRIENGFKRGLNRAQDRAGGKNMPHFQEKPLIADWHMGEDFDKGYSQSRLATARKKLIRSIRQNGTDRNFTGKGMTDQQLLEHSRTMKIAGPTAGSGHRAYTPKDPKKEKEAAAAKKKADREAEKAAREAERDATRDRRNQEAFVADKNRSQADELDSRAALAATAKERFDFERQAIDQDRKSRLDQIDKDGPNGNKRYNAAQVEELKQIEERITANRKQALTFKEAEFNAQEELKLKSVSLANAEEVATLEGSMARTAKDRRASELRLLDLRTQQEKLALEAIIASRDATEAEKEIARRRLALIPMLKDKETKQINEQNQGPLGQFLSTIPRTADEINESLQNVEVDGLRNLQSGLVDTIKGVHSLGDAFSSMADTVIDGLLNIALQQMLIKPLGSLLFGGGDSGSSGLLGGLVKGLTSAFTPKVGKANGGMGNRGRVLVGEHGPEVLDMDGPYHVTPNHKLDAVRGSGGGGINVTFGAITSNDPAAVKLMAMQAITEMAPMLTQNAKNATMAELRRPRL